MPDSLRDRIAAVIRDDLADQLKLAGYDDPQWAADVCDNTADAVIAACFVEDYRRLDGHWIRRWASRWGRADERIA
jgi:hypothetical protein